MPYEEDFYDPHEPIYSTQVIQIKRLAPEMDSAKIYALSSTEAASFIKALHTRIHHAMGWRMGGWTEEYKLKRRMAREAARTSNNALSASVTMTALPHGRVRLRISKTITKTSL